MSDKTITSANSVFTITCAAFLPAPHQLKGYATDKAFITENLVLAETMMGVDGRLSVGYVPNPVVQTVSLQADSDSKSVISAIAQYIKTRRETLWIEGRIDLPSINESFVLRRGTITEFKQLPDAQKILQPVEFKITWESIDPA